MRPHKNINCYILILLIPVFCIIAHGCKLNSDIDIEVPQQINAIVVEGYITPNLPTEISISKNNLMDDELIFQSIWNAKAYITDLADTLDLLNIFYINKNRNLIINYRNDFLPTLFSGDNLYLKIITTTGDTLSGSSPVVAPVKIEELTLSNKYLNVNYKIENNKFTGFLRSDLLYFLKDTTIAITRYLDLTGTVSQKINIPVTDKINEADSSVIKLYHITSDYYKYSVSVSNAKSAYHDPFLTPEKIKSNVSNAIGIFTYYTTDSKKLELK